MVFLIHHRINQTFDAMDMALMVPKLSDIYFQIEDLKESMDIALNSLTGRIQKGKRQKTYNFIKLPCFPFQMRLSVLTTS